METEAARRYDERDNVQGRLELIPDTPAWDEYYKEHPRLVEVDLKNQGLHDSQPGYPADDLAGESLMSIIRYLSRDDIVDGPVNPVVTALSPERAAEKIKGWAEYLGVDFVRVGPLDPLYVYSHKGRTYGREGINEPEVGTPIELNHKHAIVLVNGLDTVLLRGAPKKQVLFAIHKAYFQLGTVAVTLADYIRKLGYPARAHIVRNYQVIVPPIAIDAGVGELGRNGIVISKEFGQAMKMAVITTDLPIAYDGKAKLGVDNICRNCRICAQNCPAGAINHGNKKVVRGVERYPFNPEACFSTWKTTGTDCGVCMISCPFSTEPLLRGVLGERAESFTDKLPEEFAELIERKRLEGHDPDAGPHYHWMEEQPQDWRKFRYGNPT